MFLPVYEEEITENSTESHISHVIPSRLSSSATEMVI